MQQFLFIVYLQQHHELLTAAAGDEILRTHGRIDAPGSFPQHLITCGMSVLVVNPFEMIKVAEQYTQV